MRSYYEFTKGQVIYVNSDENYYGDLYVPDFLNKILYKIRPIRFDKFLKLIRKEIKYDNIKSIKVVDGEVVINLNRDQGQIVVKFNQDDKYNEYAYNEFNNLNLENIETKEKYKNPSFMDDVYKSYNPDRGMIIRGISWLGLMFIVFLFFLTILASPLEFFSPLHVSRILIGLASLYANYKVGQAFPFICSFLSNSRKYFNDRKYLKDALKNGGVKRTIKISKDNDIKKEINNIKGEIVDKTKKVNYLISKLDNESQMYYRKLLLSKMDLYINSMKDDNNLTLVNKDYSLIKYSTDLDMIISNVVILLDTKSEVKEMCDLRNEISSMVSDEVVDEVSDELEGNTLTLKR